MTLTKDQQDFIKKFEKSQEKKCPIGALAYSGQHVYKNMECYKNQADDFYFFNILEYIRVVKEHEKFLKTCLKLYKSIDKYEHFVPEKKG